MKYFNTGPDVRWAYSIFTGPADKVPRPSLFLFVPEGYVLYENYNFAEVERQGELHLRVYESPFFDAEDALESTLAYNRQDHQLTLPRVALMSMLYALLVTRPQLVAGILISNMITILHYETADGMLRAMDNDLALFQVVALRSQPPERVPSKSALIQGLTVPAMPILINNQGGLQINMSNYEPQSH